MLDYIGLMHTIDNLDEAEKSEEKEKYGDKALHIESQSKLKCELHKLPYFISVVPTL